MRKSVLTGIFACTLIFSGASADITSAEEKITNVPSDDEVVSVIELLNTKSDSPLVVLTTEQDDEADVKEEKSPKKHVVSDDETLSSIAKQYKTTWQRLFYKNDAVKNPDVLEVGTKLIIPEEDEKLKKRELPQVAAQPAAVRSAASSSAKKTSQPAVQSSRTVARGDSSGNRYVAGYCTWYVKNRRPDLPNNLGNAYSWISRAQSQGIPTGSTPRVGAVAQRNNHVAYVEKVNGDGTITITDMNYRALYTVTTRTVPANQWRYIY
jgi:surface antigen